jgi:hypothetical protein
MAVMRSGKRNARRTGIQVGAGLALIALLALVQRGAMPLPSHPRPRSGVVVIAWTTSAVLDRLGPVWYYQYGFEGPDLPGHQRVYLVPPHFDDDKLLAAMRRAARKGPGSWWLVGNEPNDPNQDNLSPAAYAAFYHRVSRLAKRADLSLRLVPAGIADADWRWAQAFRESYRAQYGRYPQVAAWNIHDYILDADRSQYDLAEFQRRILAFRAWMALAGEGFKPLLLTEYGVLYGSGCCNRPLEDPAPGVEFMRQATAWLEQTDYVQGWNWFSLDSEQQFNGDLLSPTGELNTFGKAYGALVQSSLASPSAASLSEPR